MSAGSSSDAGGLARLNALSEHDAREAFSRCCGSRRWVEAMLKGRPYVSVEALQRQAESSWSAVSEEDVLEAISHHPKIGDLESLRKKYSTTAPEAHRSSAGFEQHEQSGVQGAPEETLLRLAEGNRAYEARFGFIFLVFATGKSAAQMLALLEERLGHSREEELRIARGEQAKITRLRLEKLLA